MSYQTDPYQKDLLLHAGFALRKLSSFPDIGLFRGVKNCQSILTRRLASALKGTQFEKMFAGSLAVVAFFTTCHTHNRTFG
jgi:hypothetical protein